jgi:hypothetical protein
MTGSIHVVAADSESLKTSEETEVFDGVPLFFFHLKSLPSEVISLYMLLL